ncbi:MAG TPA: S53 family peptidase, partial [Acidimicrobiales bacterium]|nr:S53 family peptidase [Acidimicrobiales bacterium]
MEWRTGARRPAAGLAVLSLVVGLLVVGAAAGGAAEGARVRVGPAPAVLPHGARTLGSLPADQTVHVDLVLQGQDPAGLDAFTAAVSTPSSPDYRQYLSAGQFAARFGPAPAAVASVGAWLTSAGLRPGASEDGGLVLQADGPAAAVAAAFGTPLDAVELSSGARSYANTTAPTLPAEVAGAVRAVAGLDGLARFHPQVVLEPKAHGTGTPAARLHPSVGPQPCAAAAAAASTGSLTANQFASVYGLSGLYGQGRSGAGVNVGIYELEPYTPSDVATYQQCYGLTNRIHTVLVDGGASGPQSGEAALDIETVGALAPGATLTVYEAPNDASGPLDEWATIASQDSTKVVTTSWGNCEALIGSFATAEAPLFQQMAAQGQTVVAAAGDTGSEGCFPDTLSTGLGVSDPSSQVYVTGVGGTSFKSGLPPNESVWNDCQGTGSSACALAGAGGSGGGGLSSLWAMPSWQTGPGVANGFSNGEREVPDVSADADPGTGYVFFLGGTWIGNAGGTSAAVLVWAATTAVIDQGCAQPVGFANPALYALGTAGTGFSDVTLGNNDFTDTNIPPKYPATANYDLASGWGTPQGGALATGLQPAGGCPTVTSISSGGGPVQGGSTMTISGSSLGGV